MEKLKDLLTNCEVEPSSGCWDKLNGKLDALMPQNAPVGSSEAASTATQAGKSATHIFWTTGVKVAAAVLGTAAVATAITLAVISKDSPTPKDTTTPTSTASQSVLPTHSDNITSYQTSTQSVETETATAVSLEPIPEAAPTATTSNNNLSKNNPVVAVANGKDQNTSQSTPMAVSAIAKPSAPNIKPLSHTNVPVNSFTAQSILNDPTVQNLPEDAIDWTPPVKLEIPNVFTPNGDGVNEFFIIKGIENCSKRQLVVRSSDGRIVFKSNNYENNWDGYDCPDGVYNYQFFYLSNGVSETMTGVVHIIRK